MASISLQITSHTLRSLPLAQTLKPTSSPNPFFLPKASQPQFHGVKLSTSSLFSVPSTPSVRNQSLTSHGVGALLSISSLPPQSVPSSSNNPSTCAFSITCRFSSHVDESSLTFHPRRSWNFKKRVICRSALSEDTFIQESKEEITGSLKLKLLSAVSGLNRGLAANEDDLRKAEAAAKELESAGGPVDLAADLDKLQGRWKLLYSSAFSSRTLGGSRPGPPTGRLLPITLGQVFQRIDIFSKDFDNIVELELGAPWPLPPVEVTATLNHKFELIGTCGIKIIFEKTTVKTTGNLSQLPPLDIPRIPDALRPPSNTGSGEFEVTYLDSDTRITRGDRGELRIFVIS